MEFPNSRRAFMGMTAGLAVGATAARAAGRAPAQAAAPTGRSGGLKYRALMRRGKGKTSFEQLTMRQITGRQVLVRNQAASCTYGDVGNVLGDRDSPRASIVGNGSVGIVEEVGPQVRAVNVGDRVVVAVTPQCGLCDYCLRGHAGLCMATTFEQFDCADMADGTPVTQFGWGGGKGGLAEYTVAYEELIVPIFTDLPAEQIAFTIFVGAGGLAASIHNYPVSIGSDVAIFGAGPTGLTAVQVARLQGASRIIVVEPIPMRRQMALKVGATVALDPNQDGGTLVERIRQMCSVPTDRVFAGGRGHNRAFGVPPTNGPNLVIEAVGADAFPPKIAGPDPSGLLPLQQMWDLTPPGGHLMTLGTGYKPGSTISFPLGEWADLGGKSHHTMNSAGVNSHQDIPLLIKMIESGQFDVKSLITATYSFEEAKECYQAIADRTVISAFVKFE